MRPYDVRTLPFMRAASSDLRVLVLLKRSAASVCIALLLAACAKNASYVPALPSGQNAGTAADYMTGTRFLEAGKKSMGLVTTQFRYRVKPLLKPMRRTIASPSALPAPSACVAFYGATCYTPSEIRAAYNVPSTLRGRGQTIVIVDAYGSPTISADLKTFNDVFHLPDSALNIVYPAGRPAAFDSAWAGETTLDVEWAHAIAPEATIDLVVAPTAYSSDLDVAETYAVEHRLGSVMSMSFGVDEPAISGGSSNKYLSHGDAVYQEAREANITSVASTGDFGASDSSGAAVASYPASDPLVTAVSGTDLFMSDSGAYQSETVWNDSDPALCPFGCAYGAFGATGGAPSVLFKRPRFQREAVRGTARQIADVSYNASPYTAVMVVASFADGIPSYYFTGGTSAGTPQWAAIIALLNQARGGQIGYVNPALYALGGRGEGSPAFHDITVGQNAYFTDPGFPAAPGYDMPTGLGTPNVTNLIQALSGQNGQEEGDHSSDS